MFSSNFLLETRGRAVNGKDPTVYTVLYFWLQQAVLEGQVP